MKKEDECMTGGCHHHEHKEKSYLEIGLYISSILFFLFTFIPNLNSSIQLLLYVISIVVGGYDLLIKGMKNLLKFEFSEDTLMTIAVIAAFLLGEYPESILVILLYKLGEMIEHKASKKSKGNIEEIAKIKAETANRLKEDGSYEVVSVEKIKVKDKILIKPGEKVPVDGEVLEGESSLDTSSITGESKETFVERKSKVLSGSINLTGRLIMEVEKDFSSSTASQIVDLVYEATNNKGETEKFITKFSRIYTPTIILLSIIIATIPPIFGIYDFSTWIHRALVFLVASCPCSIVISVPLAFFSCIGAISKKGMVVKGSKHIENLSKATAICFDKTGTLTTGKMKVGEMEGLDGFDKKTMIRYIYSLEKYSNHPISTAIQELEDGIILEEVKNYKELAGKGIYGQIQGKEVIFGNHKLLEAYGISKKDLKEDGIYLAIDGKIVGYITLEEEIREESKNIVKLLKEIHIEKTVMLTGDNKKTSERIGKQIGISEIHSSLLPKEKQEKIEELKKENKVIFVGDGINDSPVLASSDFGIAMGAGTEIASSVSDGILLSNNIEKIPEIIKICRKTLKVVKQNIIVSLLAKLVVLILGFLGIAPMWLAIAADTGMTLITVLNSIRILK